MNTTDLSWWLAAVTASLLIHCYILFDWSERALISAKALELPPNSLFIKIDFPQAQAEAVMQLEEPPPEEPVEPPESPPKPKPIPKPIPKPKPKPKPVQKPIERPAEAEEIVTHTPAPMPPQTASRQLVDLRKEYLTRLLAKIEKNKFYPNIARRRNLQGMVQVRFRLGCGGEVETLEIEGKHRLLRKAAGKAVEASLPLPDIPAEIECPILVDYAMSYTLEN
ncbi:MAG: energy transducer TonB [Chromatiales bacterium]|jgi:protein TonB